MVRDGLGSRESERLYAITVRIAIVEETAMHRKPHTQRHTQHLSVQRLQSAALCGLVLLIVGLLLDIRPSSWRAMDKPIRCIGSTDVHGVVSRRQLAQLLNVQDGSDRAVLQAILNRPYCQLSVPRSSDRHDSAVAYPLEFDPSTWLIVEYAGNRYVGYRFDFRDRNR